MSFTRPMAGSWVFLGAILAGAGQAALAQVHHTERIEVTGSNLPRTDAESALPLQIITREELERAAVHSAQDILDRLSVHQSMGGWHENKGIGSGVGGTTGVALRGLGANRTLVLLNGNRIAPFALGGGMAGDLSSIPVAAIERVEVLKDGASAIYGSDAIGGVVNFILRRDFHGVEVNVAGLATQHGGGNSWRANATAGRGSLGNDRYNVFIFADHARQQALRASDRESTRTSYRPELGYNRLVHQTFPGNFAYFNTSGRFLGIANPSIPAAGATGQSCSPPESVVTPDFPSICLYDAQAGGSDSIPSSERSTLLARLTVSVSPSATAFAEASLYRGVFTHHLSPTPVGADTRFPPYSLEPSNPLYPAALVASLGGDPTRAILFRSRTTELGGRVDEVRSDLYRGAFGLEGTYVDWEYRAAVNWVENRQAPGLVSGYVYELPLRWLIEAGGWNPLDHNDAASVARLRETQAFGPLSETRAAYVGGNAKLSRNIAELAGGPAAVAMGVEARRETFEMIDASFRDSQPMIAIASTRTLNPVSRNVVGGFAEANFPATPSFEANLAMRIDRYSDFGTSVNPKLSLRWSAAREAVIRASYGTGFRAPSLYNLFVPSAIYEAQGPDGLRCPVTGAFDDCENAFFRVDSGGNPNLKPERSRHLSVGVVIEPVRGLSATIDYYRIEMRDMLGIVPSSTILASPDLFSSNVFRKPPDPQFPDLAGPIDHIVNNFVNFGRMRTSGVDLDLRGRLPLAGLGRIDLSLVGTYVIDYRPDEFQDILPRGPGNRTAYDGALSRWRHYASIDWSRGAWGGTLAQSFQNGYDEPDLLTCNPRCTGQRRVGSYSIWDVIARYAATTNLNFAVGVRNLFDRAPPLSTQDVNWQSGIDPTYADPRGRMFHASARYSFK